MWKCTTNFIRSLKWNIILKPITRYTLQLISIHTLEMQKWNFIVFFFFLLVSFWIEFGVGCFRIWIRNKRNTLPFEIFLSFLLNVLNFFFMKVQHGKQWNLWRKNFLCATWIIIIFHGASVWTKVKSFQILFSYILTNRCEIYFFGKPFNFPFFLSLIFFK